MKPHGRDEVRQALLDAATELFARRGPSNVSVRDIAARAGVNHGLVHRHFGSKDNLLGEVMRTLVAMVEHELGPPEHDESLAELLPRALVATQRHRAYWQILMRALLEGIDPATMQTGFPVVRRLAAAAQRQRLPGMPTLSPEATTAALVGLGLGLSAFEPFVRTALHLDERRWQQTQVELLALLR